MTVHKSQGQTLERAVVDISRAHDHGLAYVALSRLTNRNGLLLIGLSYDAITASPEALAELARFDAMEQNQ